MMDISVAKFEKMNTWQNKVLYTVWNKIGVYKKPVPVYS